MNVGLQFGGSSSLVMIALIAAQNDSSPAPVLTVAPATAESRSVASLNIPAALQARSVQSVPIGISIFSGERLTKTRVTYSSALTATTPGPAFISVPGASGSPVQIHGQDA